MLLKRELTLRLLLIKATKLLNPQPAKPSYFRQFLRLPLSTLETLNLTEIDANPQLYPFMETLHDIGEELAEVERYFLEELTQIYIKVKEENSNQNQKKILQKFKKAIKHKIELKSYRKKGIIKSTFHQFFSSIKKIKQAKIDVKFLTEELAKYNKKTEDDLYQAVSLLVDDLNKPSHLNEPKENSLTSPETRDVQPLLETLSKEFTNHFFENVLDSQTSDRKSIRRQLNNILLTTHKKETLSKNKKDNTVHHEKEKEEKEKSKKKKKSKKHRETKDLNNPQFNKVMKFWRLFKVAFEDRDRPVFALTEDQELVKFKVVNNQLIPVYLVTNKKTIFITSANQATYLSNGTLTLVADPKNLPLYEKAVENEDRETEEEEENLKFILFTTEAGENYLHNQKITLDQHGQFKPRVRSFKKIRYDVAEETNQQIQRGLAAFHQYYLKPQVKFQVPKSKKEKTKFVQEQDKMAENISGFTMGYRKFLKFYAKKTAYIFAVLCCGFVTGASVYTVIMNTATLSAAQGGWIAFLGGPIAWGIFGTIAGIQAVIGLYQVIKALTEGEAFLLKDENTNRKFINPRYRDALVKFFFAVLIIGIPLIASIGAPPIAIAIYIATLAFFGGVERNIKFTLKPAEKNIIAIFGDKPSDFFKNFFTITDKYGFRHTLTGGWKAFAIIGNISVIASSLIFAGLAILPFFMKGTLPFLFIGPHTPFILGVVLSCIMIFSVYYMFISIYSMNASGFNKLLHEMRREGIWSTVFSYFAPKNRANMSNTEVIVRTILNTVLFAVFLTIALIGVFSLFAVGEKVIAQNLLSNFIHVPKFIGDIIATAISGLGLLGEFFFTLTTTKTTVQEFMVDNLIQKIKWLGKKIESLGNSFINLINGSTNAESTELVVRDRSATQLAPLPSFQPTQSTTANISYTLLNAPPNGELGAGQPNAPTQVEFLGTNLTGYIPILNRLSDLGQYLFFFASNTYNSASAVAIAKDEFAADNANRQHRAEKLHREKHGENNKSNPQNPKKAVYERLSYQQS